MQHSIAARFAARPAARFVRPSARARERRLGLRPMGSFRPASATLTVLRRADLGPLVQLHAGWRALHAARPVHSTSGSLRRTDRMRWGHSGDSPATRRAGATSAPWQG